MNFLQPLIEFYDDNHSYWHGDQKLKSVGYWIKTFTPEFDENYWLTYKVFQKLYPDEFSEAIKKYGYKAESSILFTPFIKKTKPSVLVTEKEQLKWQWEKKSVISRTKGTAFHRYMEEKHKSSEHEVSIFDRKEYICHWNAKTYDNESIANNLFDLADGSYSELLVWNLDIGTAGQIDKVYIETIGLKRYVDIKDYKTNEEKPDTKCYDKFLYPIDNLCSNNHNKYAFQLSFYGWILEQFGFKVRNLAYQWHQDYDPKKYSIIEVPYLKSEIEKAISFLNFK